MSGLNIENVSPQKFKLGNTANMAMMAMAGLGFALLVLGFIVNHERAWHAYLVSFFYFTCMAMGGLFFTAIQHVASAGWSVNVRRLAEALASFIPFVFVLGLPIVIFAGKDLYLWLNADEVAKDAILQGKAAYLNKTFFIIRFAIFAGAWILFSKKIVGFSLSQDNDGKDSWTVCALKWSVAFLLVFALSFSFFSVDFLMSLEPHWFSTIFGVYCFAGLFQSSLALLTLMALYVVQNGLAKGLVTIEHVHDLGKLTKGFTVFWAYIAFSQFMLIWYANLPEETIFYIDRSHGGWLYISLALLVFRFIVPFLALLPRWAKRTPAHLTAVCILILVMEYVDIYWLVYPNYSHEYVAFSWMEIGAFVGFLGVFGIIVTRFLGQHNLIPIKDPRREESIHHHVTY
ncbi:MAG: molybdopterin oxidoreductase [Bdellovibrionaceae bacterium]|nr:molybdopterin oxidoreductase [Pseudobdellovibrionaceae bacterium]